MSNRSQAVDLEQFVRAWQVASSVAEVAQQLNMSKLGASVKASHLRKGGVPLKKFRTGIGSDSEEFISIWNSAQSLDEAAQLLGVQKTSASMRASHLRKMGHAVKKFQRGRKVKDITVLADLARNLT